MKQKIVVFTLSLLILVINVQGQTNNPLASPEYSILDLWTGTWKIQLFTKDSLAKPIQKVDWTIEGKRILNGHNLETHQKWIENGIVSNISEITRYDPVKKICVSYIFYDSGNWMNTSWKFINNQTCVEEGTNYLPDGRAFNFRTTFNFDTDRTSTSIKIEIKGDEAWWTAYEGKGIHLK